MKPRLVVVAIAMGCLSIGVPGAARLVAEGVAQPGQPAAPEAFTGQLQARTGMAGAAANLRIHIDSYTTEADAKVLTDAMRHGGYPAFVQALRKAPAIGHLVLGDEKFTLRWARQQASGKGRAITVVTDVPVYFVGGGRADAGPRDGFELAVVQFVVDEVGMGGGTMAAAARLKPDGQGGVLLEDYGEQPVKLTHLKREIR